MDGRLVRLDLLMASATSLSAIPSGEEGNLEELRELR